MLAGGTGPIDLGKLSGAHEVKLTVSPTEAPEDAAHHRWKDKLLFVVAIVVLAVLFASSLVALALPSLRAELREFAQATITGASACSAATCSASAAIDSEFRSTIDPVAGFSAAVGNGLAGVAQPFSPLSLRSLGASSVS